MRVSRRSALRAIACMAVAATLACSSTPAVSPSEQAKRFVAALNAGDVDAMMAASRVPFSFRNQEWETAADGAGFVLGAASDRTCDDDPCRRRLFEELKTTAQIENPEPSRSTSASDSTLAEHLKGAPASWRGVQLFVFLRGFGDVEHTALVGVDPREGKVSTFYLN